MRIFGDPERTKTLLSRAGMREGEAIESRLLTRQIERAQRKVEALQESVLFGADAALMQAEATRVALAHDLLTPFTSLVAVDRTPVRPADAALTSRDVPNLLPAGSTLASGFSQTAAGWKTQLGLSLLSLLVAVGMLLNRVPGASRRRGPGTQRSAATFGPEGPSDPGLPRTPLPGLPPGI